MPLLFSYGTLRDPSVQLRVFGRTLSGTADQLVGFAQSSLEVRDPAFVAVNGSRHVIVQRTGRDEDRTPGTVFELTDQELAMADAYEPAGYRRVAVRFASGRQGWVYAETKSSSEAPTRS
jgi:Gamma-glutamyl cyclotransferase, AIG2-like